MYCSDCLANTGEFLVISDCKLTNKAFDKVSHDRLLYKLDRAGIDPQTSAWVKSFLSMRTQKVVIDGEKSDAVPVTSGVPQGSVLGPILFLVYIDDMPKYTKHSQVRLFANDTIAYLTITNKDDCQNLQEDLKRLEVWEKEWLMEFHAAKCHVLRISRKKNTATFPYSLHGQVLTEVKSAKYLGVTISNDMTWNNHIDSTAAKANKKLGFLKRNITSERQYLKGKSVQSYCSSNSRVLCNSVGSPLQDSSRNRRNGAEKSRTLGHRKIPQYIISQRYAQ